VYDTFLFLLRLQLDAADTLGIPKSWGVPGQPNQGFVGLGGVSVASIPTPGSPAKGFPSQPSAGFPSIQNMTSQFQSKSL